MDWDERARRYPDEPLSQDEAADYMRHLCDQYNEAARRRSEPSPGPMDGCAVVMVMLLMASVVVIAALCGAR